MSDRTLSWKVVLASGANTRVGVEGPKHGLYLFGNQPVVEGASSIAALGAPIAKRVAIDQLLFRILCETLPGVLDVILGFLLRGGGESPTTVAKALADHWVDSVEALRVQRGYSPIKLLVGLTSSEIVAFASAAALRANTYVLLKFSQAL